MARYIDADALLSRLPDDLPYKGSVKRVLIQAPEADVVPKSEVEELTAIIADHKANEERWQELYADTVDKWEKAYEELEIKFENANTELVRKIFEELHQKRNELWNKGNYTMFECWCKAEQEIEKKYTEGERHEEIH